MRARLPDDFDPYGKDLSPCTTGKDMIFRFKTDEHGNVAGKVSVLNKAEAEEERETRHKRQRRRKK